MGKVQKRRTVSVAGEVFWRYRGLCKGRGVAMAAEVQRFMEREIEKHTSDLMERMGEAGHGR